MKNKILIIYNGFYLIDQIKYKISRLSEEIKKRNYIPVIYSSLELQVDTTKTKNIFPEIKFAIDLDKDYYLAKYLENFFPVYNNSNSTKICDDKMATILHLLNHNINIPKTISAPLCYANNLEKEKADIFINTIIKELSFPLIYKNCYGSLGKQVKLIKDKKELTDTYLSSYMIPHLYEEFLSKHAGSDYRVIVIGNKVVAVMNRINKKDFRSNIYLGGEGFDVTNTVDKKVTDLAIRANKILNLSYSGVDIMLDNNDTPSLLEVNSNPFFSEIEKVTNINITKKFIDYLLSN